MLNRTKVLQELQQIEHSLYCDVSTPLSIARTTWQSLAHDDIFKQKCTQFKGPLSLPSWQGTVTDMYFMPVALKDYSVLSVDGSQIYPDRHQGTLCFLINIGWALFNYSQCSTVKLDSKPYIFVPDFKHDAVNNFDAEMVNSKRQDLELQMAVLLSLGNANKEFALLLDGSLGVWHSTNEQLQQEALMHYLQAMVQCQQNNTIIAGYISLPQHKELVNIIKMALCDFDIANPVHKVIDCLTDTHIAYCFLKPHTRSTIFYFHSEHTDYYPPLLRPCFFYAHVGSEVIRVEIPAWIAEQPPLVAMLCAIIMDQVSKGGGYPIAIAEAHEQAVVKGADREFFYQAMATRMQKHKQQLFLSQKSIKKRYIGI